MFERRARAQSQAEYARKQAGQQVSVEAQWHKEAETWFDGSPDSVDRRLAACEKMLHQARTRLAHDGFTKGARHLETIASLEVDKGALLDLRRTLLTAATDREARGQKCKQCGKYLHDEVARAGHAHGPNGEVYDADPQYGFESRGDYQKRHLSAREAGKHESEEGSDGSDISNDAWQGWGEAYSRYDAKDGDKVPGQHRKDSTLSPRDRRFVELESAKFIANNSGLPLDELITRARNHVELRTSNRDTIRAFVGKVASLHRPAPRVASAPRTIPDFPAEMMYL